jgi:hypothetical protein
MAAGFQLRCAMIEALQHCQTPLAVEGACLVDWVSQTVFRLTVFNVQYYFGRLGRPGLRCCGQPARLSLTLPTNKRNIRARVAVYCKRSSAKEFEHDFDEDLMAFLDRYNLARPDTKVPNVSYTLPVPPLHAYRKPLTSDEPGMCGMQKCWIWQEQASFEQYIKHQSPV